ncbi:DeoR/GlpR family DNA-binding transcription regulator [Leucobacter ruminantium]|uniref:DeoR/GlpR transcriptional regulator n=1 Tax=Leucobacter ruminantium TaxID=1289170 RepID=A0A939LX33_9MICO|nr:DeoR/GlpR family DNA-binding transcription regulator [Leucobacter ruminantium]MBO1806305.1 DeoR/GlpR transcriptional regulator [Leucobacter ruminantium]
MASRSDVDQRRSEISTLVSEQGFVRVAELANRFGVTAMTIHRDLDALDARGALTKVRSGARATPFEEQERNVAFREHHMVPQKAAIAAAASDWLDTQEDVRVVALDDSTTALALVPALLERAGLTIVTNSHIIIDRVSAVPKSRLIAIGGSYSHEFMSFNGSAAIDGIRALQIDVAFISATAVGNHATFHPAEVPLLTKRALMNQSEQTVLLVDHTKFERRALHRQARLDEFAAVVVDDGIDEKHLERLREQVETVIVAPVA